MKGLIAVTDHDWFEFLRQQGPLDEANFWRPSDTCTPQQLKPGTPVLSGSASVSEAGSLGWGTFARHMLPAWLAWDASWARRHAGKHNGASSGPVSRGLGD